MHEEGDKLFLHAAGMLGQASGGLGDVQGAREKKANLHGMNVQNKKKKLGKAVLGFWSCWA